MLQPECLDCPGHKNCDYLARKTCKLCPFLLSCPAEKVHAGFDVCEKTKEIQANLVKKCLLIDQFTTENAENEQKAGKSVKFKCMRCGSYANCRRIYESDPISEDQFDIFSETKITTKLVLECPACGLQNRAEHDKINPIEEVQKESVFTFRRD